MGSPGYGGVREQAKAILMRIVEFVEKLNVNRLRAFWWSRMLRAYHKKSVFLGPVANDYPLKRTLIILTYITIT
jgi:hypothetical protein